MGETNHIIAIGGNIVGGRGEGSHPKEGQCDDKERIGSQKETNAQKSKGNEQLHPQKPFSFGAVQVHKWAP